MRVHIYINNTKVTKKKAYELIGKYQVDRYIIDARLQYQQDPLVACDYVVSIDGMMSMLSIRLTI